MEQTVDLARFRGAQVYNDFRCVNYSPFSPRKLDLLLKWTKFS